MNKSCFLPSKPYDVPSWALNIGVNVIWIIIFPTNSNNIFCLGLIMPVLGMGFIKIIARNINSVKAKRMLNNKSVKGSALSLLPEYDIIDYYLY